jgi:uncharacterized membrane protein YoaK (UPF0700 family)
MNPSSSPSPDATTTSTSALVSLVTLIVSFFNNSHIWLQNVTLIVSFIAGCVAIYTSIRKPKK